MSAGTPQLVVTIDVEPDRQWDDDPVLCLGNLVRLPGLHALLHGAGARPTYLVTHSVCGDDACAAMLSRFVHTNGCEVGAHLHPWDTPPFLPGDGTGGPKPFPTELDPGVLRAKLRSLTDALDARVGVRARSYRAGRWGLDGAGLRLLEELGYRVDSSVTPLVSWAHQRGRREGSYGPSFKAAPGEPYYPDHRDVSRPGGSTVLEVPISVGFPARILDRFRSWYQRTPDRSFALRALKLWPMRLVWFRPTFTSASAMIAIGERLLASGASVLNMAFHSSEALPGGSPYFKTEDQVNAFLRRIEETIAHFLGRGMEPATLSEVRPPQMAERGSRRW
jgi:hypothetical protein